MRRVPELDALRGIAAVVIVVLHLRFNHRFPILGSAVDLFFVLSGYLISTIILDSCQKPRFLRTFYARRALRILPIYYLTLGVYLLVHPFFNRPDPLDALPFFATYTQFIQGYWGGEFPRFPAVFSHTWTLAIEEQFYLFWPLIVPLAGRRRLAHLAVGLLAIPLIARAAGFFPLILLTRCDGLLLGALLAGLLHADTRGPESREHLTRWFAAIALLAISYPLWRMPILGMLGTLHAGTTLQRTVDSINMLRISLAYFGLVGLVICHAGHPRLEILRSRSLVYLGQISYGIYLFHPFVMKLVDLVRYRLGFHGSLWMDGIRLGLSIALAALSWRFFEQPILRLKDRFCYQEPVSEQALRGPHRSAAGAVGLGMADDR